MADVTRLIRAVSDGSTRAQHELWEAVYHELRTLAAQKLSRERPGQTLQATALVHEAYLKLAPHVDHFEGRAHFFKAAAEAMRRILIDRARRKARLRHGAGAPHIELEKVTLAAQDDDDTVVAVHEALEALSAENPENAEIVKLRYFAGLQNNEIAQILNLSLATVKRRWTYARSWLYLEIEQQRKSPETMA